MLREKEMAETITGIKIINLVEEGKIIENGSISNCGALKYELPVQERRKALIQPGEVVYILTKEKVNLPHNMYMHLSANRGMSEYGVLTLGGFAVDPGYSGRLMFGLYNYSSTPFTLIPGSKLIGGIFYQLNENEVIDSSLLEIPKSIDAFPARLVNIISKYSPTGMSSLDESIKAISKQMEALKEEFNRNKDELFSLRHLMQDTQEQTNRTSRMVQDLSGNVADLANSVKDLKSEVSDLKDGLEDEIKLRRDMRGELEQQIKLVTESVDKKLIFLRGALWTLSALVGVLGTLLTCWANGWLKFGG